MSSRESQAQNYLIFRQPTEYILVLFPIVIGVIVNVFSGVAQPLDQLSVEDVKQRQFEAIDIYLLSSKITMVILLSFFVCYRWANMLNDGSYGFWLTTGVVRQNFFFSTLLKMTTLLFSTQVLGVLIVLYLNQITLSALVYGQLFLGVISNILFIEMLAIFLSNQLRNPEFASILFITIMGFNLAFNTDADSPLFFLFQSDLTYKTADSLISFALSFVISIALMLVTLRVHLGQDIDI